MSKHTLYSIRKFHGYLYEINEKNKKKIKYFTRKIRNLYDRKRLKNERFTIISNTCIGGIIYNDLKVPFFSPTINLYIRPKDFVKFCNNLKLYIDLPLEEVPYNKEIGYPVVKLGDILLYCKHYNSFEDFRKAWERRIKRINWNNLFIIMTDRDFIPPVKNNVEITSCSEEVLKKFDNLPFKDKICIVKNKRYCNKYKSCRQLLRGNDANCVGIITNIISLNGKRMYQYVKNYNYLDFLNREVSR